MKLASLKNRTRDGLLVVVSADLTRFVSAQPFAATLRAALDDWQHVAPRLEALAEQLEHGSVPSERFHESEAMAPLPRACRWQLADDGRCAGGDDFAAPRDPIAPGVALAPRLASLVTDLPLGADTAAVTAAVVLHALVADAAHGPAFSPVVVTPDEVSGKGMSLVVGRGGKPLANLPIDGAALPEVGKLTANTALGAGAIIGGPALMQITALEAGEAIRIAVKDGRGHSVFGAIERATITDTAT